MAHGWVKSLHCKSTTFEDVHDPKPRRAVLTATSSCRSGSQALKDVVGTSRKKLRNPKPIPGLPSQPRSKPKKSPKTELGPMAAPPGQTPAGLLYPALSELPEGHPSHKVVEIIFHTSWGPKVFPGRVEMIFKVLNGPKAVTQFEEYREAVKSSAGLRSGGAWEEDARCMADGNEVMRFQCVGPMAVVGGANDCPGGWGSLQRGKVAAVCTFSGSGQAHESAGGSRGRKSMLVCRVIAGRVGKRVGADPLHGSRAGFNSVSGESGELLVYDSRAVLPCFLIIYRL